MHGAALLFIIFIYIFIFICTFQSPRFTKMLLAAGNKGVCCQTSVCCILYVNRGSAEEVLTRPEKKQDNLVFVRKLTKLVSSDESLEPCNSSGV